MATLEEFKEKEKTLFNKIYRDTLKTEISSFLTSLRESKNAETRKMASYIENYLAQVAAIYGEHFAKDTIYSGEMETRNILKRIEKSLEQMKEFDKVTGDIVPKFNSLMELCKYPYQLLKQNEDISWGFNIDNAVGVALSEVEPLIHEYFENHERKNQTFNWEGYQKAYHKVLNKFVDQAVRGNEYSSLLDSLKIFNNIEAFAKSDDKYEILSKIRETYNDSTGFNNKNVGKEKTGTYNIDTDKVLKSLYNSQRYLVQLYDILPNGEDKLNVQNQIDYIERVTQVINFSNGKSGTDLVRFFSKTDRQEMLAQFIKNMSSDWDVVANLSNNQCKKVMHNMDKYQSSKAYMAVKVALGHYLRENYERYISENAHKNPDLLAKELIGLSKFCEESTVSGILKYKKGIPDTDLKTILEDVQNDQAVSIVDVIPAEIQKQIATAMANKGLLDNRALFNTWKYSTEQYIAVNDLVELKNGVSENFENEHNVPKAVAMNILWENILTLNRINYYAEEDSTTARSIASMIKELEKDGIYADWSDKANAEKIWEGRSFEQELARVQNFYGQILPKLAEETFGGSDK